MPPHVILRFDPANALGPSVVLDGEDVGSDVMAIELRPGAVVLHRFVRDGQGRVQLNEERSEPRIERVIRATYRVEMVDSLAWESQELRW